MAGRTGAEQGRDVVIIGGGPAGLTAGLYAARAGLQALLLEGASSVSQITATDMIENYPGIPGGINGFELVDRFRTQAVSFGLEIRQADVTAIRRTADEDPPAWEVEAGGEPCRSLALVAATGAQWRRLGVPGEEAFLGRGVSYCATCDGPLFKNREVVVVGGGDTAVQEALFLTRFVKKATLVHRRNRLRAAAALQKRALENDRIAFAWESTVEAITGAETVTGVRIRNVRDPGQVSEIPAEGIFIFVGLLPNTALLRGVADLDEAGYVLVNPYMETSAPGLFACGDCTAKRLRQVVTACGDGATAAFSAQLYVEDQKGTAY